MVNNKRAVVNILIACCLSISVLSLAKPQPIGKSPIVELGGLAEFSSGDYFYFKADGARVEYLRRNDMVMLESGKDLSNFIETSAKNSSGITVVSQQKRIVGIATESLALSASQAKILNKGKALYTNIKGNGVLEVLPKVTVALTSIDTLAALMQRFNLSLDRKLRLSGNIYSLKLNQNIYDDAQIFRMARDIMASGLVLWVEPQISEKPKKNALTNDALFSQQWHLNNKAKRGALCDADCDATAAWDIARGNGTVIAIVDDGVQLNHPDLINNIWENTAEKNGTINVDDDGNGYIDDVNGYDFVVDGTSCVGDLSFNGDGFIGQDGDPSPQVPTNCEGIAEDNHGTAVAGIAAAIGNNGLGVTGIAYGAQILPVRLISDYDSSTSNSFCNNAAEAIEYAGRYADVINNSWEMAGNCAALDVAIQNVSAGTIMDGGNNVSKRPNLGSPVIFSAGNRASGWYKIVVPEISSGEHTFEWRFVRGPNTFFNPDATVWIDDIMWPNGVVEDFESSASLPNAFQTGCQENTCVLGCNSELSCSTQWTINQDGVHTRNGSNHSAMAGSAGSPAESCNYTYMGVKKTVQAGSISFWVWYPDLLGLAIDDKFEFLVDGEEKSAFFDFPRVVDNDVAYPANLPTTIAVGASTSGVFQQNNNNVIDPSKEERVYYSQYGASLDLVAPSGNQHQGIVTTDRTGDDGYHSADLPEQSVLQTDYTGYFSGTSAAAPMVAGAAAVIISTAAGSNASASQIKTYLQNGADPIGNYSYNAGISNEVGHGRLNVYQSIRLAQGSSNSAPPETCTSSESFSQDLFYAVTVDIDAPFSMCPTLVNELTPSPEEDFCFPIKAKNGNVAVICL